MYAWAAFALSVLGLWFNARKNIWCWPVWLLSNLLWIAHTLAVQEWAALATWCVFLAFNGYGWLAWRRPADSA